MIRSAVVVFSLLSLSLPAQDLTEQYRKAMAAAGKGDLDTARSLLRPYVEGMPSPLGTLQGNVCYDYACLQARAGEADAAFEALERAIAGGWRRPGHLAQDGDWAQLRDDPRFAATVERLQRENRAAEVTYSAAVDTPYSEELSDAEKVAGVSKIWMEVKFHFVYLDQLDFDWDALYLETLEEALLADSTLGYYEVLSRFVNRLGDGHTNVYPPDELQSQVYARPQIQARKFGDRVAIVRIGDPKLEGERLQVGTEVVAIDGVDVHEYAATRVTPFYLPASTPQDLEKRWYTYGLLAGADGTEVALTLRNEDGEEWQQSFPRQMGGGGGGLPLYTLEDVDGVAHLTINSFNDGSLAGQLEQKMPELLRSEAMVIDLRANGGGNTPTWLLQMLAREPFRNNRWMTRVNAGSYRAWGRPPHWTGGGGTWVQPSDGARYDKPVALLISEFTFSAAEDFASVFQAMGRGPVIGVPSGGSTGQPLFVNLPGGGRFRYCSKRDANPAGKVFVGIGVQPDIVVEQTLDDLRQGFDPALETALARLR